MRLFFALEEHGEALVAVETDHVTLDLGVGLEHAGEAFSRAFGQNAKSCRLENFESAALTVESKLDKLS
jgi:hypothetical protein